MPRRHVRSGGRGPCFILSEFPNNTWEWGRKSKKECVSLREGCGRMCGFGMGECVGHTPKWDVDG
jgi:hypothetical protein